MRSINANRITWKQIVLKLAKSTMFIVIVFAIVLLYVVLKAASRWSEPQNLPPGECWFPFRAIFNRSEITAPCETLMEMAKVYGDVFTIKRGRQITVFINNISVAKKALQNKGNDFAGRAYSQACDLLTQGRMGFINCDFDSTLKLHNKVLKLALHMITDTCFSLSLEQKISKEADFLVDRFKEAMNEPFDPKYKVYLAVVNAFSAILFEKRYKINDPEFYEVVELNNRLRKISNNAEILDRFPLLRFFPVDLVNDVSEVIRSSDRLLKNKLREHRSTFMNDNIRDFTDALLKAFSLMDSGMSRMKANQVLDDDNLILMIMDVFFAGVDPVSATLSWVIAHLASHPHVQAKLHLELDAVMGSNRHPSLSDRSRLSYLQAVMYETLRLASPVPLSFPHKAVTDSSLQGFTIPKGCSVIFNFWAMHHDGRQWENPYQFRPERFIDAQGNLLPLPSLSFLPFGCGSRGCLGQSLAMQKFFLFFSRLVSEFKFSVPPGCDRPSMLGTTTVVREPRPFRVFVTLR